MIIAAKFLRSRKPQWTEKVGDSRVPNKILRGSWYQDGYRVSHRYC
jgi:hypothetical protein